MCGHLYLVGFPLLDDDAWQGEGVGCGGGRFCLILGRCIIISPEKTWKNCFPANLCVKCLFDMLCCEDRLTGRGYRAYEVHKKSWPLYFSIYRWSSFEMIVILFVIIMCLSMMICRIIFLNNSICRFGSFLGYHTLPYPSLQLFESAKDNMKMIFSTILDWKLQADGYPGEVASLSKWLGLVKRFQHCLRRCWWELYVDMLESCWHYI